MKALKILVTIIISCIVLLFAYDIYDEYKNKQAYDVKDKVIKAMNLGFKEQKPIELENIGGINWEQICFISYELNGIDVSNGLDIPFRYLKVPQNAFSQIANESYTEFKGSEYGMVFWSLQQETFIAIPLEDAEKTPHSECHNAKNLVLLNKMTPKGRLITLSQN